MSFFRGQSEIHSTLLQDLANNLTDENFQKLKSHCKAEEYGRLGFGQLEKIKTPSELFERLQQKAVIKEGNYAKLKNLLKLCENEDAIDLVKRAETDLTQAGKHVEGLPYPGSGAAMQKYGPLTSHDRSQTQTPPPAYSQQPGGQVHHEYMSNVPQQSFGRFPEMTPQQYHVEPIHKSDAFPSMASSHPGYHSGGYRMPPPGNHYNQSNFMTAGNQFVAPHQSPSPMQGVSPGQMPNPNVNQSCGRGNLQMMDDEEYYDMKGGGYILFINNYFKGARGRSSGAGGIGIYDYREGAEKDTEHIRYTCNNHLTNHVLDVEEEVGKNKFWGILDDAYEKLRRGNFSSFILIISSHGIQKKMNDEAFKSERIVLVDESEVTLEEIKDKFSGANAPFLNGKPKVFIVQACRGDEYGRAVPDKADCSGGQNQNLNESVQFSRPANADVLEAFATSSGTRAWRNSLEGTWYINHLCRAINENTRRDHFLDLLLRVHNQIAGRVTNNDNPAKQMPCYVTTFTKKFRLI